MTERLIGDMAIGETGYAVNWALKQDGDGNWHVKLIHDIKPKACGTAAVLIRRTENGYEFDAATFDRTAYERERYIPDTTTPRIAFYFNPPVKPEDFLRGYAPAVMVDRVSR